MGAALRDHDDDPLLDDPEPRSARRRQRSELTALERSSGALFVIGLPLFWWVGADAEAAQLDLVHAYVSVGLGVIVIALALFTGAPPWRRRYRGALNAGVVTVLLLLSVVPLLNQRLDRSIGEAQVGEVRDEPPSPRGAQVSKRILVLGRSEYRVDRDALPASCTAGAVVRAELYPGALGMPWASNLRCAPR